MNERVQRGLALKQNGQSAEAAACFRQALAHDPANYLALTNLAILNSEHGQPNEAETLFRQAARFHPLEAGAHFNLGILLSERGRRAEASTCFRQALALNPNHQNALRNLAAVLMEANELAEAAQCYRELARCDPYDGEANNNLGTILRNQNNLAEAIACYQRASTGQPRQIVFRYNLAIALREHGQSTEAFACCREILQIEPRHNLTHLLIGDILRDQGQVGETLIAYRDALRCDPNHADTYNNMASLFYSQGDFAQAQAAYLNAIRLEPSHAVARFNLGVIWLTEGDYERGWPEYEFRFKEPHNPPRHFVQPRWDGRPLAGKTILLYAEQGLGDTIQFIRYARLVKDCGGRVLLECQRPLAQLLAGVAGVDQVVIQGEPLPPFDVQMPLMSLGHMFRTTVATIPAAVTYLRPGIHRKHATPQAEWNVGIVWQGSPTQADDRDRSVPLAQFAPLAKVPGVRLFSLQVGHGTEQLANAPFAITDLGGQFDSTSFVDIAAVLPNLDLVVTVCTSVAHLAGAMGVPVWVVSKYVPHWVWQLERADSPWYPSLRLFRQKSPGAWSEVFERIARDLGHHFYQTLVPLAIHHAQAGHEQEAEHWFRQIVHRCPHQASAHYNLGNLLMGRGDLAQAIACYTDAIRLNPEYADAHCNLGNCYKDQGQLPKAVCSYREALRIKPNDAESRGNLANVLKDQGFLAEASAEYDDALKYEPQHANVRLNRGMLRLLQGDFASGWDDYEYRWQASSTPPRTFNQPLWDGSTLDGKTILLYAEQGLGDTIHFIRYAAWVKKRGATVIFECPQVLVPVLRGVPGIDLLITSGRPLPFFHCHAPLLSLPRIFGTTVENIPAEVPYIKADPQRVEYWCNELRRAARPAGSGAFHIGIVWQGNPGHKEDRLRSTALAQFEALARHPRVTLVGMQKGPGTEQIAALADRFPVVDLGSRFDPNSLADLAAALANMDLIVTVDTAAAHLAGALGRPVWTLLQSVPDWRWLLEREDCPWYPTMRLFRQRRPGDWADVFQRLANALDDFVPVP